MLFVDNPDARTGTDSLQLQVENSPETSASPWGGYFKAA
jgi:hypothetical protein